MRRLQTNLATNPFYHMVNAFGSLLTNFVFI